MSSRKRILSPTMEMVVSASKRRRLLPPTAPEMRRFGVAKAAVAAKNKKKKSANKRPVAAKRATKAKQQQQRRSPPKVAAAAKPKPKAKAVKKKKVVPMVVEAVKELEPTVGRLNRFARGAQGAQGARSSARGVARRRMDSTSYPVGFIVKSAIRKARPKSVTAAERRGKASPKASAAAMAAMMAAAKKNKGADKRRGMKSMSSAGEYILMPTPYGFDLPVFVSDDMQMNSTVPDVNGLVAYSKRGNTCVFGSNAEVDLRKNLASGEDGTVFTGFFGPIPDMVVIKVPKAPIGHIAADASGRVSLAFTKKETANLEDVMREYIMMSQVKCDEGEGKPKGPIVCALGAASIIIGGSIYAAIALEYMDTTSSDYAKKLKSIVAKPINVLSMTILMILKALRNIRRLHALGFNHMDSHDENWLVKYKGLSPMDLDIRLADMGRSCKFTSKTSKDSCAQVAKLGDIYDQYAGYHDTIEYSQFMMFVTEAMRYSYKMLKKQDMNTFQKLMVEFEKLSDAHFDHKLARVFPRMAGVTFEQWVSKRPDSLESMLRNIVYKDERLFSDKEIDWMEKQGLVSPS